MEEKIESVASESPEEEVIQMADGTTLRMSDLTFDDDDFKPEKKPEKVE